MKRVGIRLDAEDTLQGELNPDPGTAFPDHMARRHLHAVVPPTEGEVMTDTMCGSDPAAIKLDPVFAVEEEVMPTSQSPVFAVDWDG